LPWLVGVTLTTPIVAYFAAIGTAADEDTYAAVKKWVHAVWAARAGSEADEGSFTLEDPERTRLILSTRIPDEALDALSGIDWELGRGKYLVWDQAAQAWHDPTHRSR
jgi:hypothetical protein